MRTITQLTICLTALFLIPSALLAQVPDPSRVKGLDQALAGHRHQTYQRHARDNSQILYSYSQSQQPVQQAEAHTLVTAVQRDLTASDKALATVKAANAKDAEIAKQIEVIEKLHKKANEVCATAAEHCAKEHGDQTVIANCCSEMWTELTAAQKETEKLFKMLKLEKLEAPKQVTASVTAKKG